MRLPGSQRDRRIDRRRAPRRAGDRQRGGERQQAVTSHERRYGSSGCTPNSIVAMSRPDSAASARPSAGAGGDDAGGAGDAPAAARRRSSRRAPGARRSRARAAAPSRRGCRTRRPSPAPAPAPANAHDHHGAEAMPARWPPAAMSSSVMTSGCSPAAPCRRGRSRRAPPAPGPRPRPTAGRTTRKMSSEQVLRHRHVDLHERPRSRRAGPSPGAPRRRSRAPPAWPAARWPERSATRRPIGDAAAASAAHERFVDDADRARRRGCRAGRRRGPATIGRSSVEK